MTRVGAIALAAVTACLGCGGGTGAAPTCARAWSVTDSRDNPGLAVAIDGGALSIAAPLAADELVSVVREGVLEGDFTLEIDFDAFAPGTTSAYLHATLDLDDPNLIDVPFVGAGIGVNEGQTDVRALLVYHDESRTRFDLAITPSTAGTLRIARVGREMVLTATGQSGELAEVTAQVSDAPTRVGLQFSNAATEGAPADASVRITEFRIEGGGGVVTTDHFDCDSLL
jgi:hypothetical protein